MPMMLQRLATAALILLAAAPLSGCPAYTTGMPMPMPYYPPVAPRPDAGLDGPSLYDAYQGAARWMGAHYPGYQLLSAEGLAIGQTGRAGAKGWTFKFAVSRLQPVEPIDPPLPEPYATPAPDLPPMPVATPAPRYVLQPGEEGGPPADGTAKADLMMPARDDAGAPYYLGVALDPTPVATQDRQIPRKMPPPRSYRQCFTLTVDGGGRVLAPEDAEPDDSSPIDFTRTLPVTRILEAVADLGSPIGSAGARVHVYADAKRGAVVEVDPQVATRIDYPAVSTDDPVNYPTVGPVPGGADGPYADGPYADGPYAGGPYAGGPYADGPYADGTQADYPNRGPVYGVKCMAAPTTKYSPAPSGVLYRGSYLFDAYTGVLLARPTRI